MALLQSGMWWDSKLRVDVCPIPRSLPYSLRHRHHHRHREKEWKGKVYVICTCEKMHENM
ncbi:hypothetical protein E2C01_018164 [Portunus trituberculatus]|uniref:Uncharacterized protein n=1 Tax=Portunus trituberculatus TaxID=210409 RepID=A0A5B7DUS7_PORTR|nr:hypothetical protein [Portunus trituberculatus]